MMESEFSPEFKAEALNALYSFEEEPMRTVLGNFYSVQDSQRTEAQTFIDCCKKHHSFLLLSKLYFVIRSSDQVETRENAARVLRYVRVSDHWAKLRESEKETLKNHFLTHLCEEESGPILREFCLVVSDTVSKIYKVGEKWPQLLQVFQDYLRKDGERFQDVSLVIITNFSKDSRWAISSDLSPNMHSLHCSLLKVMGSANPNIKIWSFRAAVSLVRLFSHSSNRRVFPDLLKAMTLEMVTFKNNSEYNWVRRVIHVLITLVSESPESVRPHVEYIVLNMLRIADYVNMTMETRCYSLKLVMIMAELKELKPLFLKLPHNTVHRLITVARKMLDSIEEDMVHNDLEDKGDTDSCNGRMRAYNFGIEYLIQLSMNLARSKLVSIAYDLVQVCLDSSDWRSRYAGIKMMIIITEKISDENILMVDSPVIEVVARKIQKSLKDSNFAVRAATFKFMNRPTRFIQAVHTLSHHNLLGAFLTALDDSENVKEQVPSAILHFLKNTLPVSLIVHKDVHSIITKFLPLLSGNATAKQRFTALSTFNFVANCCRDVAIKQYLNFLPILLEACNDSNSEVKEEAVRGIRFCAEFGKPEFLPFINRILSKLSPLMEDSSRTLPENAKSYDIAVSALGRISEFHRDSIDPSKLVPVWLSHLPLKNDLLEAKIMHEQLHLMVARSDSVLFGPGNKNLPKIVKVFLQVIEENETLATAGTVKQISNLLRYIWWHFPCETLDGVWSSLNAQQQDLLLKLSGDS